MGTCPHVHIAIYLVFTLYFFIIRDTGSADCIEEYSIHQRYDYVPNEIHISRFYIFLFKTSRPVAGGEGYKQLNLYKILIAVSYT